MRIADAWIVQLKRPVIYLPYLLAPLSVAAVYCFFFAGAGEDGDGGAVPGTLFSSLPARLEELGLFIIGGATGIYWLKAVWTRNLTYVLMLALAACLFLRELHWEPADQNAVSIKDAIFPLLALCAAWFIAWRKLIDGPLRNFSHTVFFVPAIVTYALGQAIERRLFRFMPHEDVLHTFFEEAVECCAHLLILGAAVFGSGERKEIVIRPDRLDDACRPSPPNNPEGDSTESG